MSSLWKAYRDDVDKTYRSFLDNDRNPGFFNKLGARIASEIYPISFVTQRAQDIAELIEGAPHVYTNHIRQEKPGSWERYLDHASKIVPPVLSSASEVVGDGGDQSPNGNLPPNNFLMSGQALHPGLSGGKKHDKNVLELVGIFRRTGVRPFEVKATRYTKKQRDDAAVFIQNTKRGWTRVSDRQRRNNNRVRSGALKQVMPSLSPSDRQRYSPFASGPRPRLPQVPRTMRVKQGNQINNVSQLGNNYRLIRDENNTTTVYAKLNLGTIALSPTGETVWNPAGGAVNVGGQYYFSPGAQAYVDFQNILSRTSLSFEDYRVLDGELVLTPTQSAYSAPDTRLAILLCPAIDYSKRLLGSAFVSGAPSPTATLTRRAILAHPEACTNAAWVEKITCPIPPSPWLKTGGPDLTTTFDFSDSIATQRDAYAFLLMINISQSTLPPANFTTNEVWLNIRCQFRTPIYTTQQSVVLTQDPQELKYLEGSLKQLRISKQLLKTVTPVSKEVWVKNVRRQHFVDVHLQQFYLRQFRLLDLSEIKDDTVATIEAYLGTVPSQHTEESTSGFRRAVDLLLTVQDSDSEVVIPDTLSQ